MRKFSLVLVAALFLIAGNAFASNNNTKGGDPIKGLSAQITKLLKYNTLNENDEGQKAQVLFILNDDKEIVVLSVETDKNDSLERFIKSRLNYQVVDLKNYEAGKKYTVSVRVVV